MSSSQPSVNAKDIHLVRYKTEPTIIPAIDIQKHNAFPFHTGGFGDIWKCSMSTRSEVVRVVAIKTFRVPFVETTLIQRLSKKIRREAYVWMQLSHENILPLEGVTEGFDALPALVTRWMDNGSLGDYLKQKIDIARVKRLSMLTEIAAGLEYLHCMDIVHGDLTPSNILVDHDMRPCIGDFGLSMILAECQNSTFNSCHPGNVRWIAPEMLDVLEDRAARPTKAADVYSYGCIMILLCSGLEPYHWLRLAPQVIVAKMTGRPPFRKITGVEEDLEQLAQQCLLGSSERPPMSRIIDVLEPRIDVSKALMELLSKLRVNQITKAALSICDNDDRGSMSGTLKYNWLQGPGTTVQVAVKTLDARDPNEVNIDKAYNMIRREVYVRERMKHETILDLYGITTGIGILPSFVHPWMSCGSLHDYLEREFSALSSLQKFDIRYQVADGIRYLHSNDFVHGNLTGDNVLLDDAGRVRIADFSRSVILGDAGDWKSSEQLPGAARYVSPESVVRDEHTEPPQPSKAHDVYSYGCITILVLSGKVPYWWISEESEVLSAKVQGTEPFLPSAEIDPAHLDLLRPCLSISIESRPSIEKVLYSVLVQRFGATDLTRSVTRLSDDLQAHGGFSTVHKCSLGLSTIDESVRRAISHYGLPPTTTSVDVAVKDIRTTDHAADLKAINRLFREIQLWLRLKHENIVPLWGVTDGAGSIPALVSPWLENGSLTRFLQRKHEALSVSEKIALLRDVAHGLVYLHSICIVHGDLSGNNVLVDTNGKALLTDFGLSALLSERLAEASLPTKPGGTARWMAPESLGLDDEDHGSPVFFSQSDIYSFGGIMLQVLEGKVPYHYIPKYENIIAYLSQGTTPKRPVKPEISDSDWYFIQRCWSKNMHFRPSAVEIVAFLERRLS